MPDDRFDAFSYAADAVNYFRRSVEKELGLPNYILDSPIELDPSQYKVHENNPQKELPPSQKLHPL